MCPFQKFSLPILGLSEHQKTKMELVGGRNDAKAELQYFGHLMRRVDSLEKTLMLGGIGGKRRRGR